MNFLRIGKHRKEKRGPFHSDILKAPLSNFKWQSLCGHIHQPGTIAWVCTRPVHDKKGERNAHRMKASYSLTALERLRTGYGTKE